MSARRSTATTSSPAPGTTRPVSAVGRTDWCWCGNRAVARCPECASVLCERHRVQEGMPPPQVLGVTGDDGLTAWPYLWQEAWQDVAVELGWLTPHLAEQLFHAGYAANEELALCQPCRTAAGIEVIADWAAMTPPRDGWDRAQWLLHHGFEPERVETAIDAGPPRRATVRFLDAARAAGVEPPSELTVVWSRDRRGAVAPILKVTGWIIEGALPGADPVSQNGHTPRLFVTRDGETYVFAIDKDPSVGRVQTTKRGRGTEYRRLGDDHWNPTRLAVVAFDLRLPDDDAELDAEPDPSESALS